MFILQYCLISCSCKSLASLCFTLSLYETQSCCGKLNSSYICHRISLFVGSCFAEVDDVCFDFVSNNAWNCLIVAMSVDAGRTMCIVKLNVDWERVDVFDDQQVGGDKTHVKNSKGEWSQAFDSSLYS